MYYRIKASLTLHGCLQVGAIKKYLPIFILFFRQIHKEREILHEHPENKEKPKRKTWEHPWRYREGFLVVIELILLSFILEVLTGSQGAPVPSWPANLFSGVVLVGLMVVLHARFRKNPLIKWLSSVPAAVSAIVFFAFVTLLLGFIPQDNPEANRVVQLLGLTRVKSSWLMLVSGFYFLVALGFVALRRSRPLSRKNIGFLLNHAGLWLTIAAGYLGAGDMEKLIITVEEEKPFTSIGFDQLSQETQELPFALRLDDFFIEEYNPKIGIIDARTGMFASESGQSIKIIEEGLLTRILDWEIAVKQFLPHAFKKDQVYYATDSTGSAPAAEVNVKHIPSGSEKNSWISCGNFQVPHRHLQLNQHYFLVMTLPEPEKYASDLRIRRKDGSITEWRLEVNKPYRVAGWKLYQLSYDDSKGRWSEISVLEAVRDPWLPVVYTGIFMLLAGALYLFWIGREAKE